MIKHPTTEIAIVILNWNTKAQLEAFLPSVIRHSQDAAVEIIIADNGSDDGSVEFLQHHYPELRTIIFPENYGFTGGYNQALAQVQAKYYVILNSDIQVTSGWLDPLKRCLDTDDSVAACMPKIKSYHHPDYFEYAGAAGGFIDRYGYPFCRGRIMRTVEKDIGQYNNSSEIFWATGACMFVRAELFHRFGGFDNDFFAHMEEIDLCWRMKNQGYTIHYVPQSLVYHVGGGTLPNENPFKLLLNHRNNLFLLYKNLPGNKLVPVLLIRMLMDGLSALMYLIKGKGKNFLAVFRAYHNFVCSWRTLHRKRMDNLPPQEDYPGHVYDGCIVYQYFIKKNRYFSSLSGYMGDPINPG